MESAIQKLAHMSVKDKKSPIRVKQYIFKPTASLSIPLFSYNIQEYAFRQPGYLPINARGLFVRKDNGKIVVRGYDKFFNIGEVEQTKWPFLESMTAGPYELTLKENGCIIFVASIDGHVLVTSKHAFGPRDDASKKPAHSEKGEEWLDRHLQGVSNRKELSAFLEQNDVTAVFELADDDFEEHVLEYPPDKRGLYCHGLNYNTPAFNSVPTVKVHEFAKKFGFPIVKFITKDTVKEVREFGEECAKTGCYEGSPVEGFVVRCHRTDKSGEKLTHFFKIKFEEPYLMFREWREVTKSVISGRAIRKGKFALTAKYVMWAQGKYRQKPYLFRGFNAGKGIIALRNMFLQEVEGLTNFIGAKVIELCKIPQAVDDVELEKGKEKILLIPVATIASGKTTLARCLALMYPDLIGHIQNDNIQVKKSTAVFEQNIMESFLTHDIVFADRNNHLFQHRDGLSKAFKAEYPAGKIIALDWNIGLLDKKYIMDLTAARIEERGENHQSLTPKRTKDYRTIIGSFVMRRDEVDLDNVSDSSINQVISMYIQAPVIENLETVLQGLNLGSRPKNELEEILTMAVNMKETTRKVVKNNSKSILPAFYGLKVRHGFYECLRKALENEGKQDVFDAISTAKGANREWHMTIVYRGAKDHPLLLAYDEMLKNGDGELGKEATITSSRVIMNNRIITLLIEKTDPPIEIINKHRHISLALLNEDVKATESNQLIQDYIDGQHDGIQSFPLKMTFMGEVCGF